LIEPETDSENDEDIQFVDKYDKNGKICIYKIRFILGNIVHRTSTINKTNRTVSRNNSTLNNTNSKSMYSEGGHRLANVNRS